ncbi:hypothetical protein ABZ468_54665 [Streptomyces sp. NPDC005708]|uniref:hypothetical protein n=1 Tax=Streptomyces sp. NPDC005708 TaxID=3154564 RepID=UPI0033C7CDCA
MSEVELSWQHVSCEGRPGGKVGGDMTRRMNLVLTGGPDSDQDELDALTFQLRDRLLELDVDRAELHRSGAVPPGSKPGEVVAVGALVVTMAPIALRAVMRLLETWIQHRPVRTVSVTIGEDSLDVQGVSSAEQRRLIDAFIATHGPTLPPGTERGPEPPPTSPATQSAGEV